MNEAFAKIKYVERPTAYQPRRREGEMIPIYKASGLKSSGAILLTEVVIINTWFLSMMMKNNSGYQFYFLSEAFKCRCEYIVDAVMIVAYIWFASAHRKPPDKPSKMPTVVPNVWNGKVSDFIIDMVVILEEWIILKYGIDVDLIKAYTALKAILFETMLQLVASFIKLELNETFLQEQKISDWNQNKPILFGSRDRSYFPKKGKQVFTSQVVLSYSANMEDSEKMSEILPVDENCYQFAIDTCTTFHICRHEELFVNGVTSCDNLFVQGIGGRTKVTGYGTIKIRVVDDQGQKHDLLISNALFVPESPTNLISPQKWSLSCEDKDGTGELTGGESTIIFWNKKRYFKFVPHHPQMGIPIITVNDDYTVKTTLLAKVSCQPEVPCYLETSTVVKDDQEQQYIVPVEDEELEIESIPAGKSNPIVVDERNRLFDEPSYDAKVNDDEAQSVLSDATDASLDESEKHDMDVVDVPKNELEVIAEAMDSGMSKHQRELLRIHYNLKHLPFSYLKRLAKRGIIPKYLENVDPPLCTSCIMGKQHRKPWRSRGKDKRVIRRPSDNFPGAMTSTDQMISPYGGLIPQVKGRLMKAKFYAAQVKVDHFTDYTYLHLMKDTTADSTLEAKNSYERLMQSYGHKVLGYHADNGRFAETAFRQDCKDKAQKLSFCGVGSHHQNGIAERRIRSISEDARTMLAHGHHLWPEVITKSLWPFALKAAVRARNKYHLDENGLSPEEKMSGVKVKQLLKNEHPLFCPVFVLDRRLQGGKAGLPKWNPRSSAGVYLGHSPEHSSDVALVLNLTTGLVSPQYHVIFDDTFSTVESLRQKKEPSNWEVLCKHHTEDYRMAALPTNDNTATDLQNEVQEWLTSPADQDQVDSEGFENVVVDEFDAVNDQSDLLLENEHIQDFSDVSAREGEQQAVQFDLEQNETHEYQQDAESDDESVNTQVLEDDPETPKAWRKKIGSTRTPTVPLIGSRRSSRVPTPSYKLQNTSNV